jgi:hypothetical protein
MREEEKEKYLPILIYNKERGREGGREGGRKG